MTDAIFLFQLEKPYVSNFECENTIFDTIYTIKRNYANKNLQIHRPLNPEASQRVLPCIFMIFTLPPLKWNKTSP